MAGMTALDDLRLAEHGAQLFRGSALPDLLELKAVTDALPPDQAGIRLHGVAALQSYLAPSGSIGMIASKAIGTKAKPVRAILFDKSAATNWSLGWHQDRTICVRERIDAPGFGPWSIKARFRTH